MSHAPPPPSSGFGKETTVADILARITWERWAAAEQRKVGYEALAQAHDLTRVAYEESLRRLVQSGDAGCHCGMPGCPNGEGVS